jgi:hypothetical protein
MPQHTAKSLFDLNMQSSDELLNLYDGILHLRVRLDISWLLRAAIVFSISAFDAYFHDKVKYRAGHFKLSQLPPALAKFEVPLSELPRWDAATRKGNAIRNWITKHYSVIPLQRPEEIAKALKLVGIDNFWPTVQPNDAQRKILLEHLAALTKRRNQIAHEGDREGARNSGKRLRPITRAEAQDCVDFVRRLVGRIETEFPR